jgi:hypothetical protein
LATLGFWIVFNSRCIDLEHVMTDDAPKTT